MQGLYDRNADFKEYVDRYAAKHHITEEEALQHAMVKEYADIRSGQTKIIRSTHTPMGECV